MTACYGDEMKLTNMQQLEKLLISYYEVAAKTTGRDITVKRAERLMKHIGNPEKSYPIVHVAGTSGKTSTTY